MAKRKALSEFKSLAPSAEMLSLLEHADRSIIMLDTDFRILWFNARASQAMYSFCGESLKTGTSYWDYVDRDQNKRFIRNFQASVSGRRITTEQRVKHPEHTNWEFWVEGRFSPLQDENDNVSGVIYSFINISDRKRAERDQLERENVLQAINRNDSQAFILLDETNHILSCNALAPLLLSKKKADETPYGKDVLECIHQQWTERFNSGLKLARSGGTASVEFESPVPDDTTIEVRFTPVKDRLGKRNMVSIWAFDISDKKAAEREVKRSEENLRAVFNSSSQSFLLLDRKLNILAFNKASERLMKNRFNAKLKIGSNISDFTEADNLVQFKVEAERAFSGRKVVVEKYFTINDEEHWFERHINPVQNEQNEVDRIALWSLDITERKKAEKALKENESKFRKLASLLPVGIYQVDLNGNVIYLNESLQLILGANMSEILEGSWSENIHEEDRQYVREMWKTIVQKKQAFSMEYRTQHSNGTLIHVLEQAQPLFNHLGEYMGYLGTIIDVSEQKRTQQLEQEKKVVDRSLKFRSDFLASMSHELRTPLNGIMGLSELLLDSKLNDAQRSKVQNIQKVSEDLKAIVNEVLDLSKLEAGKMELKKETFLVGDMIRLIEERFAPEADKKHLSLKVSCNADELFVVSDRRRITQVLSNLVGNALKFTRKGDVSLTVVQTDGTLRFTVKDTGPGIPSHEVDKLFQDFSQLDHTTAQDLEGTGLGLSISKKLVNLLGGKIGVESEVGKGSTFWFQIPIEIVNRPDQHSSSSHKTSKKPATDTTVQDVRVLLVEDNLINQQAFKVMLKKMGCKVDVLSNGKQAVEQFDRGTYDIVFMDIQMPEMDGLQAASEIKKRFEDVPPVVGLSGNMLDRDDEGRPKDTAMDDLLLKPVVSSDMEMMIRKWVA